jgi:energy-coupling factor transporter transmembrane protein EcfT
MPRRTDARSIVPRLHPATLLLCWGGVVAFLQTLSLRQLAAASLLVLPLSWLLAPVRTRTLVRRARWLLLSIAVLFALASPGQRLPGAAGQLGITYDGLDLAAEHVIRLVLLLATLAILHQRLGNEGLIAGLHWLLKPLAGWREARERIVVRLMLVLDYVETEPKGGWRTWLSADIPGPDRLLLVTGAAKGVDWLVLAAVAAAVVWWWW